MAYVAFMWETRIRWLPLMGTETSVGSLCSHLAWPFEESVLSLHLVLGLHRTVGIRQAAVRRVPDISPPSPHETDFYVFAVDVFPVAP